jgi:hypothetical protein
MCCGRQPAVDVCKPRGQRTVPIRPRLTASHGSAWEMRRSGSSASARGSASSSKVAKTVPNTKTRRARIRTIIAMFHIVCRNRHHTRSSRRLNSLASTPTRGWRCLFCRRGDGNRSIDSRDVSHEPLPNSMGRPAAHRRITAESGRLSRLSRSLLLTSTFVPCALPFLLSYLGIFLRDSAIAGSFLKDRSRDPQPSHFGQQRGSFQPQFRRGTTRSTDDPAGLL